MLGASQKFQPAPRPAYILKPPDISRSEPFNDLRIIAEGPGADDGVVAIVVYIDDWRKNGMNSRGTRLGPHNIEHCVKQFNVFFHAAINGRRHGALVGKTRPSGKLLAEAPLHIGRDQKRDLGKALEFPQMPRSMFDRAPEKDKTANAIVNKDLDLVKIPCVLKSRAVEPGHDHLSNFLPE
jgi:hypothetical protein